MAMGRYREPSLKEELTCSICCDLFTDPVMLDCMHHFCKGCILQFWQGNQRVASCPHCRMESPNRAFRTNYMVTRVVDRVRRCSTDEHQRKVQTLDRAWSQCSETSQALRDAAGIQKHPDNKKQLEDAAGFHQRRREEMETMKQITQERISSVKKTSRELLGKIREDFQWLHQILEEEERITLAELGKEEEKAVRMLQLHIQKLEEGISELQKNIEAIHQTLAKKGDVFLLEAENIKTRPSAHLAPQPLINTALWTERYSGPLQYTVWKRMLKSIRPVPAPLTFDQETAHPNLIISADLKGVTEAPEPRSVQVGPKCFQQCVNVLGSESFRNGCHYWEVWVGSKTKWDLGVAADYVDRKTKVKLCPENGYWTLRLRNGTEYWAATTPWTRVPLLKHPRKVGIYLSCEEGRVGFYDAEDMVHLFTFHHARASRFYPFFSTCFSEGHLNREPMRICHLTL